MSYSDSPILQSLLQKFAMMKESTSNVANVNTFGYKRRIPESHSFNSILAEALKDPTQGSIRKTNRAFDIAIEGNAEFLIDTAKGLSHTRNGRFLLNNKGELVTQEGHKIVIVDKTDKNINLALEDDIKISEDGEIKVNDEFFGRIALRKNDDKPVKIHQGHIEGSNVDLIQEMFSLQQIYRAFDITEKFLGMEAGVDKELIEKYGRNV